MKISVPITVALVTLAVACHKSDAPPPKPPAEEGMVGDEGAHEKHEHDFPAEVTAFHDVMSPLWHAEAGDERKQKTCAAVPDMSQAARAIEASPVPEKVAAEQSKWHEATAALTLSLETLGKGCAGGDFEGDFKAVHDRFHDLVALLGHEQKQG